MVHASQSRAPQHPRLPGLQGRPALRRRGPDPDLRPRPAALQGGGRHPGHAGRGGREVLIPPLRPHSTRALRGPHRAAPAWIALTCALAAVAIASPARSMPARVGTLSTAPDRIAFDVEVPALELRAVEGEDGLMTPLLEDYGPTGPVGSPGMPGRVLTVAIPP